VILDIAATRNAGGEVQGIRILPKTPITEAQTPEPLNGKWGTVCIVERTEERTGA